MSKHVSSSYEHYSCYLRLINRKFLSEVNESIMNSHGCLMSLTVFSDIDNPINSTVVNSVLYSLEVLISEAR